MIHMSQVKVPVKELVKKADRNCFAKERLERQKKNLSRKRLQS